MTTYVYRYTMTNDSCFAPSITENYLTLACCKGGIKSGSSMRESAWENFSNGDSVWVIGVAGKDLIEKGKDLIEKGESLESFWYHPVYIAKITECVQIEKYYDRSNPGTKRFSAQKDWNSYKYIDGKFESQEGVNEHHGKDKEIEREKDTLQGSHVLVSGKESFHYFGRALFDNSIFPNNFLDKITDSFLEAPRGYKDKPPFNECDEFIGDLYKILENYPDNGWRNQGIDENNDAYKKRVKL